MSHNETNLAVMGAIVTPDTEPELFFERNYDHLQEVFDGMGLPAADTKTLEGAFALTQPWVKGDHSRPGYKLEVRPQDSERFHAIYGAIGMKHEVAIPPGEYAEVNVLGSVHTGNRRRTDLLARSIETGGVVPERVSLIGGQRRLYAEVETEDIEASFATLDEKDWHTDWSRNIRKLPVARLWETDAMRLAAMERLGPLALERLVLRNNDASLHEEADPLYEYEFTAGDIPLSLVHALAVERPNGERRHNTDSCVADWLERRQLAEGARIAFINGNPHTERMGRTTLARLRAAGREDLQVVIAGSAVSPALGHGHYLREIAANLYEDMRQVTPA